ncbi:hypothetical protein WMY93_032133 [Mugilogobius chulae]|uniref:Uncharacterized protein n=1 Tax=Mugilogobius chulae TaxID=88201 RepID=A0AAW0MGD0_9GOBI
MDTEEMVRLHTRIDELITSIDTSTICQENFTEITNHCSRVLNDTEKMMDKMEGLMEPDPDLTPGSHCLQSNSGAATDRSYYADTNMAERESVGEYDRFKLRLYQIVNELQDIYDKNKPAPAAHRTGAFESPLDVLFRVCSSLWSRDAVLVLPLSDVESVNQLLFDFKDKLKAMRSFVTIAETVLKQQQRDTDELVRLETRIEELIRSIDNSTVSTPQRLLQVVSQCGRVLDNMDRLMGRKTSN